MSAKSALNNVDNKISENCLENNPDVKCTRNVRKIKRTKYCPLNLR